MALRKLASIQKVLAIDPIPDADNIERITINGWTVVSQKGNFQVGDLGVFYETDSIPPEVPLYQFLWQTKPDTEADIETPRPEKYRLKSKRLRGQLSQGLMLPLNEVTSSQLARDEFYDVANPWLADHESLEGLDLTELLAIQKWERLIPTDGEFDGDWSFGHSGVSHTDEERIQSRPWLLDELRGLPYYASLKYDGCSLTCGLDRDYVFRVNNRTLSIAEGDNGFWYVVKEHAIDEFLLEFEDNWIIQGELCKPGLQGNPLELKTPKLFVFDIWDTNAKSYLGLDDLTAACERMGLNQAEVIERGDSFDYTLDECLEMAEGKYPGTNRKREGLVWRPQAAGVYSPSLGGRLSFKTISNSYALAEKD